MTARLYLSFWHVCLDNLPQGDFTRGIISADDARTMIGDARTDRTLLCVSKEDLLAPYRARERRRHEQMCELLRVRYDFDIRFGDFLATFDDDGTSVQSIMPLEVAELRPRDRMLIVTCNYQLTDKTDDHVDLEDRFVLAADSVAFHLVAALPSPNANPL